MVAADSRSPDDIDSLGRYTDDECKIAAPDNKYLVAVTGYARAKAPGYHPELDWDAIEQARKFSINNFASAHDVAKSWVITSAWIFDGMAKVDPNWFLRTFSSQNIATAFFASLDIVGRITVSLGEVNRKSVGFGIDFATKEPPLTSRAVFTAFGVPTVVEEVEAGKTAFAQKEAREWKLKMAGKSQEEQDTLLAIRYAELTIRHYPNKAFVGGDVDAAILRAGTGISWIQRKQKCAAK